MLALELWFTIVPVAVGWPPEGSAVQAVIETSWAAVLLDVQPAASVSPSARATVDAMREVLVTH